MSKNRHLENVECECKWKWPCNCKCKIEVSYFSRKVRWISFQVEKVSKFRAKSKKSHFSKIALNRILTLPDYSRGKCVVVALKIVDLQINRCYKQYKHWISVPVSYKNDDWGEQSISNSRYFHFLSHFKPIIQSMNNVKIVYYTLLTLPTISLISHSLFALPKKHKSQISNNIKI